MLRLQDIKGNTALSDDGDFGSVVDFIFDDKDWVIRYVVADIEENNTAKKRIVLPPNAINEVNHPQHTVRFNVSDETVMNSPRVDENMPISRQMETELLDHYKLPYYWKTGEIPSHAEGDLTGVPLVEMNAELQQKIEESEDPAASHLRSMHEVTGYGIMARDGEIGEIHDFVVDETSWRILYLIANTGNWLVGRKVLLSPTWIDRISWMDKTVQVNLTRETIQNSPEYDPESPLDDRYHDRLAQYYRDLENR